MAKRLSIGVPPANSYPYRPFAKPVLMAIVDAARYAWLPIAEEIRRCGDNPSEQQLNSDMAAEMDSLRRERRISYFTPDVFETPVVDASIRNFSGKRISTRPDITIHLRNIKPLVADPILDAVFIECKRIRKSKNLAPYFNGGIKRFLDGDYAWAVQQAFMIGYLETDQTLPQYLEKKLIKSTAEAMQVVRDHKKRLVRPSGNKYLAYTRHQRIWQHRNEDQPGDIELLHIWLSCND